MTDSLSNRVRGGGGGGEGKSGGWRCLWLYLMKF